MFQQHVFRGSRRTGKPDWFNSGDGTFDLATANLLKWALGETERHFGVALAHGRSEAVIRDRHERRPSTLPVLLGVGAVLGLILL